MKKPLSFGATMLASALGVVIVSVVAGVLLFVSMIAIVSSVSRMDKSEVHTVYSGTVLNVDLSRIRGDRTPSALQRSLSESGNVGLIDACAAIRSAATDARVNALYLTDPEASSLSWGSLTELRDALLQFKASGKPIISYSASYSQQGYYLCSVADSLFLHPSGMVDFRGIGAEVMHYKDMLDKLGVEMQLIRPESCSYKSAGEVYTLNHMSEANREQIRIYITSIWHTVLSAIATSRSLPEQTLSNAADNLSACLASDAVATRLVDSLCFEADVKRSLKEVHHGMHLMPMAKYATGVKQVRTQTKNAIAVVYAEGNVYDGASRGIVDGVYSSDIVKALRQATDDPNVKAIVLRVNSPGGQATASESMTHAVMQAREKKPVVVSMGDLAASAGYEISCMANAIVAQPTTITGSIGVFGTVPNAQGMLTRKLGLNTDTVLTNRNAGAIGLFRPLSPTAKAMMMRSVEEFYHLFVERVAEGRNMSPEEVHSIARGRVWTGADAVKIGLVDTLGGLDVALAIASQKAGIEEYAVKEYPKEKDVWTQLSEMLSSGAPDGTLSLSDKVHLALGLHSHQWALPSRIEQDIRYVGQSQGLQARLPFVADIE